MTDNGRYIDRLEARALRSPESIAILSESKPALTSARLWSHIREVAAALSNFGLGRNDRVAIVLPNGPEMATAFFGVSACATAAPLNPAYGEREFEFYVSDLRAKALIVASGADSAATAVARARGIPVLFLAPVEGAEAGIFRLDGAYRAPPAQGGFAMPDDVALVLHTSGTTARSKIVPLTHANLYASAVRIAVSLGLSEKDRCLNVMPLFHIHGLVGALLSTMVSGGSIVCTPGFDAGQFLDWMPATAPSWYTAVPTMHQAILRASASRGEAQRGSPLRFIRSCSAALPPTTMEELEKVFQVPVVEAYGMTEASHQMATNPLPPAPRKPGSVGLAAGIEIAIMDQDGGLLRPDETGEIVIRGPNVMGAYENNAAANESAFTAGWFRTGDRGYLDESGYLYIAGRIKEMINRGGEKISPREIDEALLEHPGVEQALAFAVPHPTLGEDVAAAVVAREGCEVTERSLRDFVAQKLAAFKVPRRIVFVPQIPKGPTGKPQRIGLAEKLGIVGEARNYTAPRTSLEEAVAGIWREVLGQEQIGVEDDFFELGGDSIMATQALARLREILPVAATIGSFLDHPTVAEFSAFLATLLLATGANTAL